MVASWKASGLTAHEFGAQHGISKKQLHNWAYRLGMNVKRRQEASAPAVRLLPVVRRAGSRAAMVHGGRQSGIRVNVAGASMDVEPGFNEATLRKILIVVKEVQEGGR